MTGTSVKKDEGSGKLVFFERATFQKVYEIDVTSAVSPAAGGFRVRRKWWKYNNKGTKALKLVVAA